jgi:hypothetical protein
VADLFQWWQQDLTILPDGDLLLASDVAKSGAIVSGGGTAEGEQRVIRRLLTAAGTYIWHLEYGAGLPQYVGQPAQISAVAAIIRAQLLLEDAVVQSPPPNITAAPIVNGLVVNISYMDNRVGRVVTLGFDINA